ncbi:unnamed protein product, partial [Prunus brigantina]
RIYVNESGARASSPQRSFGTPWTALNNHQWHGSSKNFKFQSSPMTRWRVLVPLRLELNPRKFIRRGSDDMQAVLWRSEGAGKVCEPSMESRRERAVRKLMVDDDGKGMRVRARESKEKIEVSMKGGSTYHSLNELVELMSCGFFSTKSPF